MTILSLNIWDLPFITKDRDLRMMRLIKELKDLNPDIICLQESWEPSVRRRILAALPDYQTPAECLASRLCGLFDVTGGLFVMMRRPLRVQGTVFQLFDDNGYFCFEDWIGKKGFLTWMYDGADGGFVMVNAHLHVRLLGTRNHHQKIRKLQINQMITYLEMCFPNRPLFLLGDFNFESSDPEYHQVVAHGFCDASSNLESQWAAQKNVYEKTYLNGLLTGRSKLDYVFTKGMGSVRVVSTLVFDDPPVSNHYGILAEIRTA